MSIQSPILCSTSQRALLARETSSASDRRRRVAQIVAMHHGWDLVAVLKRCDDPKIAAAGERFVADCARGAPAGADIRVVLDALDALCARTRPTGWAYARAVDHRSRITQLEALNARAEALEAMLSAIAPTDMETLTPLDARSQHTGRD